MIDLTQLAEDAEVFQGAPSDAAIQSVSFLAKRQQDLERDIAAKEAELKKLQADLEQTSKKDLPEAMRAIRMSEFTLDSGYSVSVSTEYYANIPALSSIEKARGEERDKLLQRRTAAFAWLREQNHDDLIKNEVSIAFGKNEDGRAWNTLVALREMGLQPRREESVHSSTLKAFVREQTERGVALPVETLGIHIVDVAKVQAKKEKR